VNYIIT